MTRYICSLYSEVVTPESAEHADYDHDLSGVEWEVERANLRDAADAFKPWHAFYMADCYDGEVRLCESEPSTDCSNGHVKTESGFIKRADGKPMTARETRLVLCRLLAARVINGRTFSSSIADMA